MQVVKGHSVSSNGFSHTTTSIEQRCTSRWLVVIREVPHIYPFTPHRYLPTLKPGVYDAALTKVPQSGGLSTSASVAIRHSRHMQQLLGDRASHNARATRCRNEPNQNTATFASNLPQDRR